MKSTLLTSLALALSTFLFTISAAPAPTTAPILHGTPFKSAETTVATRDTSVRLTFLNSANSGYWVDIPLDTGYISPINLDGLIVATILPWANFDTVYCVFWGGYPVIGGGSLSVTYDPSTDVTEFTPAAVINYVQCCNGKCPDWQ